MKKGFWIEIRPLTTAEVEPLNFKTILDRMYGTGKPFKFIIANTPSERIPDQYVIRFFLGFPDEGTKKQMSQIIQSMLPVQVLDIPPPEKEYPRKVEMCLQRHFALPIVDLSSPPKDNLIDILVSVISETGGVIEIVGKGDKRARSAIYNYILSKTHRSKALTRQIIDTFFNIGAEIAIERDVKDISREAFWRSGRAYHIDEWLKQELKAATLKMQENAFHCEINLYGDPQRVYELSSAFPSWINKLQTSVTKHKQSTNLAVDNPTSFKKQHFVHVFLQIFPLLLLGFAFWWGAFKPLKILTGELTTTDTILLAAVFIDLILLAFHRKRRKVVLSSTEISSIIGVPSAIGKLPVELGTAAPSRRGLVRVREEEQTGY